MAFVEPTVDSFKSDFTAFASADEDQIALGLRLGDRMVDQSWTEGDYTRAKELVAAHFLASTDNADATGGMVAAIQSETLGSISVSYATAGAQGNADPFGLSATIYGQQFMFLAKLNRGGARSF